MSYRVVYAESCRDDMREHVRYLRNQQVSDEVVEGWYERVFAFIETLETWPRRFRVDERHTAMTGIETRRCHFNAYLIRYQIDKANRRVNVIGFSHGARREP